METRTLPVDATKVGTIAAVPVEGDILDELNVQLDSDSIDAKYLKEAAEKLKFSDIPVAFPTETVYGLGADATRSAAVKGIYKAKQRPSDNPLIVHFASLKQLRSLLRHDASALAEEEQYGVAPIDPIPEIYRPLISRFWPGPLTIILPNPTNSPLAPEVTAGLDTFGARIPRHALASTIIQLAGVPIAAPSANASTKPSPTAAEHVAYDLNGRIEVIIDGGPCDVGVESTVVDGLSHPPAILRPGGISLEQLRDCPGWENVQIGYQNASESGSQPRAPGMKYRHYSPKATVVLFESRSEVPSTAEMFSHLGPRKSLGFIRTRSWQLTPTEVPLIRRVNGLNRERNGVIDDAHEEHSSPGFAGMLRSLQASSKTRSALVQHNIDHQGSSLRLLDINLGNHTEDIARGIFSALRDLDKEDVNAIFVEGIDDNEGDTAAAIMNRLRKAAEVRIAG